MAVGFAYFLDRVAAGCTEYVGEVELFGDFGNRYFAKWIVDFVDADRSEPDGCRHFVAEDHSTGISEVRVDQLPWDNSVAEESLT